MMPCPGCGTPVSKARRTCGCTASLARGRMGSTVGGASATREGGGPARGAGGGANAGGTLNVERRAEGDPPEAKPRYWCDACNKSWAGKSGLWYHRKRVHGDGFKSTKRTSKRSEYRGVFWKPKTSTWYIKVRCTRGRGGAGVRVCVCVCV